MDTTRITPITEGDTKPACPEYPHRHVVWVPVYLPFLGLEEQQLQNKMISGMDDWEKPWWVTRREEE